MNVFKSASVYFAIVFGAGFLLALIRIPLLVPRFGARASELMEMPVMVLVIYVAARWTVRRHAAGASSARRLGIGFLALALLLLMELGLLPRLQGLTAAQAIAAHDPVSGGVYAISLLLFALMPLLIPRNAPGRPA